MRRLVSLVALLASAVILIPATSAFAGTSVSTSTNWAGYALRGQNFRRAAGAWVEPTVTCTAGKHSFSAFWVGIGGYSLTSTGLEQIGTEADCDSAGNVYYTAWYELVPAPPVTIKFKIAAGDSVSASVAVSGHSVLLEFRDSTTGKSYTKRLNTSDPDVTSAEWIAEAPSACTNSNSCSPLPLTNFGMISFTGANATTVAGHTGVINDPSWRVVRIDLTPPRQSRHSLSRDSTSTRVLTSATPSALDPTGSSFTVNVFNTTVGQVPPVPQTAAAASFGAAQGVA